MLHEPMNSSDYGARVFEFGVGVVDPHPIEEQRNSLHG